MIGDILSGLFASALWAGAIGLYAARSFPARCLYVRFVHPRRRIRVSVAVLVVIRKDGDFLLVESRRRPGQWGPISGAMQYYPTEREIVPSFAPERPVGVGPQDLRGTLECRDLLRLIRAVRRRERCEAPEGAAAREFYEEVVSQAADAGEPPFQFMLDREATQGPYQYSDEYGQFRLFFVTTVVANSDAAKWIDAHGSLDHLRSVSRDEILRLAASPQSDVLPHSLLLVQESIGFTYPSIAEG